MTAAMKISKPSKTSIVREIIKNYTHDYTAEGSRISKRRLWYILKPQFTSVNLIGIKSKGKQVQAISNADFSNIFNALAQAGEIDDSYIYDISRTSKMGEEFPHIILVAEKATVESQALNIAEKFGLSVYIAGGFSSIYGARQLVEQIREETSETITILMMSDYDKSGIHIQDTAGKHLGTKDVYRVLLEPSQVPVSKLGDYFGFDDEMGNLYELDVLNFTELVEVFIANIPTHIAGEIKTAYELKIENQISFAEVEEAVESHPEVIALRVALEAKMTEVRAIYQSAFIDASPVTILPFTTQDIYDGTVKYTVNKWKNKETK